MIQTADNHHWSSMYSTMITLAGLGDVQKPIGSMVCPSLTLHLTSELMFMYIFCWKSVHTQAAARAEHRCTCRLPGSLPTGIFLKKNISGPVKILSHSSPGPTGKLPAGHSVRATVRATARMDLAKI